jgi:tRNA(Ile)-lysidine synthase
VSLAGFRSVVLSVSGGADSMALLVLAEEWRRSWGSAGGATISIATVDHGLRPESAAEARWVEQQARAAGFSCHILQWTGEKPRAGVQEAARVARYGLLMQLIDHLGLQRPVGLVAAHHLDDQAETFLMRLARGSGVDGLSAMLPARDLEADSGVRLVRPFLEVPKARLVATLEARGRRWIEDPSNRDTRYERVRVRAAVEALSVAGIGPEAIAMSARRLLRAREALEQVAGELAQRELHIHGGAFAELSTAAFASAPFEVRLRLLRLVIGWFGGDRGPVRMARLESLVERLGQGGDVAATLSGCRIAREQQRITVVREPGRRGLPEMALAAGETRIWDGRFRVSAPDDGPPFVVKPLAPTVLSRLLEERRRANQGPLPFPRAAALTLPTCWIGERFVGVLHPAFESAVASSARRPRSEFVGDRPWRTMNEQ